jgi:hypothetical protein
MTLPTVGTALTNRSQQLLPIRRGKKGICNKPPRLAAGREKGEYMALTFSNNILSEQHKM